MNVAQENTLRALKDETLIVSSWLCRIGLHRWDQWSDVYRPKGSSYNIQHSHCVCCNKMRIHKVVGNLDLL